MEKLYGINGKMLRVDLTTGISTVEDSTKYLPEYYGGRGLAARLYWDEIDPDVAWDSPDNKLIFAPGALEGTGAAGAVFCSCATKPSIGYPKKGYIPSLAGTGWGGFIKFAGFDAIIIQGKSEKPVYIYIENGKCEIRDASHLWGRLIHDTQDEIKRTHGEKTRAAMIGPAGENLVCRAAIMVDSNAAFAQGGQAAVMGSKNLKAVAVQGSGRIAVANPKQLMEDVKTMRDFRGIKVYETKTVDGETISGVARNHPPMTAWGFGVSPAMLEEYNTGVAKVKARSCPGCVIGCRALADYPKNPEWNGCSKCGTSLFNSFFELGRTGRATSEIIRDGGMLCDDLGLDASWAFTGNSWLGNMTGGTKPSALQLGIITEENTGLNLMQLGTQEFGREWLNAVAYRSNKFTDLLAQGDYAAVEYILDHEEFGPNREKVLETYHAVFPQKGVFGDVDFHSIMMYQEQPGNPIRLLNAHTGHRHGKEAEPNHWVEWFEAPHRERYLGVSDEKYFANDYWGPMVAKATLAHENMQVDHDMLGICNWAGWNLVAPGMKISATDFPPSPHMGNEFTNDVFGTSLTQEEHYKVCERIHNLERAILVREGYTREDDLYVDDFYETKRKDGTYLCPKEEYEALVDEYYSQAGWSNGCPTRAKLEELDLGFVADDLEKRGLLPG